MESLDVTIARRMVVSGAPVRDAQPVQGFDIPCRVNCAPSSVVKVKPIPRGPKGKTSNTAWLSAARASSLRQTQIPADDLPGATVAHRDKIGSARTRPGPEHKHSGRNTDPIDKLIPLHIAHRKGFAAYDNTLELDTMNRMIRIVSFEFNEGT